MLALFKPPLLSILLDTVLNGTYYATPIQVNECHHEIKDTIRIALTPWVHGCLCNLSESWTSSTISTH